METEDFFWSLQELSLVEVSKVTAGGESYDSCGKTRRPGLIS